ncbi:MAG: pyridoxal phosphate-dependent aminotransferase [Chloroflexi bacterium]|nr:pyridoxal phosphate-dependent aminotransferase [Chloroflexota bacterium]
MRLATRVRTIGTESAFEAAGRARALEAQGRPIIHLEIGEPDFDTPAGVRAAAQHALDAGWTHYGPPLGLPQLREAIAEDATARKGFPVDPSRVVVTPGAKPVMAFAMLALGEPGVEVIVPDPGFPIYASMASFAGATPVPIPLRQERDFRIDIDELASLVTPRTRLLVINSPHNPCGSMLTPDDLRAIADLAIEHDLVVLSDEIYARIVYEGEAPSIAALPGMAERTIVLDGFSKTYAMTGWRLGYALVPEALVPVFGRLMINTVSCTATFSQLAAVEALRGPQDAVDAMVEEFRARRELVVTGLRQLPGVTCAMPAGAFYAFPDVSGTGMDGPTFAERLLVEADVSVLAGTAFGDVGRDHVRVSYANSRANLTEALDRMARLLA